MNPGATIAGARRRAAAAESSLRGRAAPLAYRAAVATRRPTAGRRVLPDFLIIGAQKCGTTFLRAVLDQHPAITMSIKPEVHYFDWNFHRGTAWYQAHFPTQSRRERDRGRTGEFATGEKSPYYLFDPSVPARVRALLPEVRLIVLLRDPVHRALSHHRQATRRGHETLPFEAALERELRQGGRADHPGRRCSHGVEPNGRSYIARGRYAEQLERWLAHFDREQIHVTVSEPFFANPGYEVSQIQQFLGLTPLVENVLPRGRQDGYAPMSPEVRRGLREIFAHDIGQLTRLLGESPGWW